MFTFSKDPVSHIAHCMTAMWTSREALRDRIATLEAALKRQVDNVERWMETGVPADAEESRSIYEQMVSALREAKGDA